MVKIWAHTIVCNEERYLWFAVMSVVDFVDKILLWDTGSTDNTVEIIKKLQELKPNKISFKQIGRVNPTEFTHARQQMLEDTKSDWFLMVDGDEVWWQDSIKRLVKAIQEKGKDLDTIVIPHYNIVGDIYHYQEEEAGNYVIDDKKGHISIRAINRKIPGLHFSKPYGQEGIYDKDNRLIQDRDSKRRLFLDTKYMHFTNMIRSQNRTMDQKVVKRSFKFKYEIGNSFPKDFSYPEVFYKSYPDIIPSPWEKMSKTFLIKAAIATIPRKIKRRLFHSKSGY